MPDQSFRYALRLTEADGLTRIDEESVSIAYDDFEFAEWVATFARQRNDSVIKVEVVRVPLGAWEAVKELLTPEKCLGQHGDHSPIQNRFGWFCSRCDYNLLSDYH